MAHFHIPSQPATTNKTVRFPNDVNERVEAAIQGKDCTFSAFVIAAVRAALDDLEDEGEPGHPDKPSREGGSLGLGLDGRACEKENSV